MTTTAGKVATAARETPGPVVGWALWEGDRLHGHAVHATKESLLVGYDMIGLGGLDACEEHLMACGYDICPTEVTTRRGGGNGVLYSIAINGQLAPYALEWSCVSSNPEVTLHSAVRLLVSCPDRLGVEVTADDKEILLAFAGPVPVRHRKTPNPKIRKLFDGVLAKHGVDVVPLRFRKLETPPRPEIVVPPGYVLRKWFNVEVDALVDPWDQMYSGFRGLEVFGAWARTAERVRYRGAGPFELLSCSSAINLESINAFTGPSWRDDLERRFLNVLLSRHCSPAVREWREANGIGLGKVYRVNHPTLDRDGSFLSDWLPGGKRRLSASKKVDRLLAENGWLAWSLNTCWPGAIRIKSVWLKFGKGGAAFLVEYGHDKGGGSWHRYLAFQRRGEPLALTVDRAIAELDRLKDPDAAPPIIDSRSRKGLVARPAYLHPSESYGGKTWTS